MGNKIEDTLMDEFTLPENIFAEPRDATYLDPDFIAKSGMGKQKKGKSTSWSDWIHAGLQAAGMSPGYGIFADIADSIFYGLEGEWGDAAISAAAATPLVGQQITSARTLKRAKDAGEEFVTLYRGTNWHAGKMVKDRKFVGGGGFMSNRELGDMHKLQLPSGQGVFGKVEGLSNPNRIWLTQNIEKAREFVPTKMPVKNVPWGKTHMVPSTKRVILEFSVPKSYYDDLFVKTGQFGGGSQGFFSKGLPVEFLTKVHKNPKLTKVQAKAQELLEQ